MLMLTVGLGQVRFVAAINATPAPAADTLVMTQQPDRIVRLYQTGDFGVREPQTQRLAHKLAQATQTIPPPDDTANAISVSTSVHTNDTDRSQRFRSHAPDDFSLVGYPGVERPLIETTEPDLSWFRETRSGPRQFTTTTLEILSDNHWGQGVSTWPGRTLCREPSWDRSPDKNPSNFYVNAVQNGLFKFYVRDYACALAIFGRAPIGDFHG